MASSGMSFTTAQAGLMATKLRMRPMAHRPLRPTMERCMCSMRDTRPQVWARAPPSAARSAASAAPSAAPRVPPQVPLSGLSAVPSARPSSTRSTVRAASSSGIQLLSLDIRILPLRRIPIPVSASPTRHRSQCQATNSTASTRATAQTAKSGGST